MGAELVQPHSTIPRWRWRNGSLASDNCRIITLGRTGDGLWYADYSALSAAFEFDEPGPAVRLVQGWLNDGREWVETPGSYNPFGRPDDGLMWSRRGGLWFPA